MKKKSLIQSIQTPNKPCIHPWFYLWINAAGDATICPQNKIRLGSLHDKSFDEIWNNPTIKNIRKNFIAGKYEEAGCERECPYLRGTYKHSDSNIPVEELIFPDIDLNNIAKDTKAYSNISNAIYEYENDILTTKSHPSIFDSQNILTCNADCIMCGQPHNSKLKHPPLIKDKILEASKDLVSIRWQGGEVFLDQDFIQDLEQISDISHDKLLKIIITNGSLLTQSMVDKLFAMRGNLKFIVSMDGATEGVVDKIRYKLKYKKIIESLTMISKKQQELNIDDMIMWNYTLMKSNISEVSQAIEIAKKLKININFAAIQGKFPKENLFEYQLLEDKEWQQYMNQWKDNCNNLSIIVSGFDGLNRRYLLNKGII